MMISNHYNTETGVSVHVEFNFGNSTAPYRVKAYGMVPKINMHIDQRFNDYENAMNYYNELKKHIEQ